MPSFHQDGLFEALLESGEVDLRVVFAKEAPPNRVQLGWIRARRKFPSRMLSSSFKFWDAVRIAWKERRRVHIVNGIWAEPSFAVALCVLALSRSKFVVYAEAPDPRYPRARFRTFLGRLFAGFLAKRTLGFLAVSHFAEQFYPHIGFAGDTVYPFGYFQTHNQKPSIYPGFRSGKRIEVIFVGQLIQRKGVDLLLEAMRPLFEEYPNLFLSVVGGGSEGEALKSVVSSLGIADRVNFEGTLRSDKVPARLALVDVLVLPSRWDGWGMVVNEALSAGVPVIVSDQCGAADLVRHGSNGYVFRSESVEDLRGCVRQFLDDQNNQAAMRSAAADTSLSISASVAASYLLDCLRHMSGESKVRPVAPWYCDFRPEDTRA